MLTSANRQTYALHVLDKQCCMHVQCIVCSGCRIMSCRWASSVPSDIMVTQDDAYCVISLQAHKF